MLFFKKWVLGVILFSSLNCSYAVTENAEKLNQIFEKDKNHHKQEQLNVIKDVVKNANIENGMTFYFAALVAINNDQIEDAVFFYYASIIRWQSDREIYEAIGKNGNSPFLLIGGLRRGLRELIVSYATQHPKLYANVLQRLKDWNPNYDKNYSPSWEFGNTPNRLKAKKTMDKLKKRMVALMSDNSQLLNDKIYFKAFLIFKHYSDQQKSHYIPKKEKERLSKNKYKSFMFYFGKKISKKQRRQALHLMKKIEDKKNFKGEANTVFIGVMKINTTDSVEIYEEISPYEFRLTEVKKSKSYFSFLTKEGDLIKEGDLTEKHLNGETVMDASTRKLVIKGDKLGIIEKDDDSRYFYRASLFNKITDQHFSFYLSKEQFLNAMREKLQYNYLSFDIDEINIKKSQYSRYTCDINNKKMVCKQGAVKLLLNLYLL